MARPPGGVIWSAEGHTRPHDVETWARCRIGHRRAAPCWRLRPRGGRPSGPHYLPGGHAIPSCFCRRVVALSRGGHRRHAGRRLPARGCGRGRQQPVAQLVFHAARAQMDDWFAAESARPRAVRSGCGDREQRRTSRRSTCGACRRPRNTSRPRAGARRCQSDPHDVARGSRPRPAHAAGVGEGKREHAAPDRRDPGRRRTRPSCSRPSRRAPTGSTP